MTLFYISRGRKEWNRRFSVENVLTIELVSFLYYSRTRYRDSSLAFRNYGVNLFNFVFFFSRINEFNDEKFLACKWECLTSVSRDRKNKKWYICIYISNRVFALKGNFCINGWNKKKKKGRFYLYLAIESCMMSS